METAIRVLGGAAAEAIATGRGGGNGDPRRGAQAEALRAKARDFHRNATAEDAFILLGIAQGVLEDTWRDVAAALTFENCARAPAAWLWGEVGRRLDIEGGPRRL